MCEFLIAVIVACIIAFILCRTQFGSDLIEGFFPRGHGRLDKNILKNFARTRIPTRFLITKKKLKFEVLEISVYKYIKLIVMLQHYIKSFRRGLWDNKCLPAKWIVENNFETAST